MARTSTRSTFLFTRPSFGDGMARLIDYSGSLNQYNRSATPEEADYRALKADWEQVGIDLKNAMNEFGRQTIDTTRSRT
jgi:hypothetical protein